jgi:hypothetical protein
VLLHELTEGRSTDDTLYHFSSIVPASRILASDSINLTPDTAIASDVNLRKGKSRPFYLSLTRHKLGGYHLGYTTGVMFNLDGSKLANNFKITAVDYWGAEWYPSEKDRAKKNEAEDRLYSNKSSIENISKYIKSIHVLQPEVAEENRPMVIQAIRDIAIIAKKSGIPFSFYNNQNDFLLQKNAVALPVTDLKIDKEKKQQQYPTFPRRRSLKPYLELLLAPIGKLSKESKRLLGNLTWSDSHSSLSAHMHNDKKSKDAATMTRIMIKNNLRTPKEVIDFIIDRWSETDSDGYTNWLDT